MGAQAAQDFTSCKVVEIVASGKENGHIQLNCTVNNPKGCQVANFVGFDKSTIEGEHFLTLALTAFVADLHVSGHVDHNTCAPYQGNIPKLTSLRLTK